MIDIPEGVKYYRFAISRVCAYLPADAPDGPDFGIVEMHVGRIADFDSGETFPALNSADIPLETLRRIAGFVEYPGVTHTH